MPSRQVILVLILLALMPVAGVVWWMEGGPKWWQDGGPAAVMDNFRSAKRPSAALAQSSTIPDNPARPAGPSEYEPHEFDWPQWQGPDRSAVSRETGLLQEWPKSGPPLKWQADYLGEGFSTPTVASGRVFSMGDRGKTEFIMAFSEADGGEIWATAVGPIKPAGGGYPGPRSSPTVDGDRVYALGIGGDLLCVDAATGKERWRKDLRNDFGGTVGGWGYCESPLVDGNKVLCTPGGEKATMVALNKETGDVIWKASTKEFNQAQYASMIPVKLSSGEREYVQFISGAVVGVSEDGHFLWRYTAPSNPTANCSSPLFHDDAVFAASGYNTGGGLAKLETKDGKVEANQVYFTKHMKNHHGGMVLVDGYIYGSDDSILTCLDWKTGEVKWSDRKAGKGSIAAADGRLYFHDETGEVLLLEANPKKCVEHGRFAPERSGRNAWARPVIANGKLYIRDEQFLFCYDVKKK
jgi:outer membrane protein assembly factor BamB